jgi:hypothetical protein
MSRTLAHDVTEYSLDAAFFASLEELRSRAEQAVEDSIRLRTEKGETHKYWMEKARRISTGWRVGELPLELPPARCHACGAPIPLASAK